MKKILFALCLLLFVSCTRDVVLVLPPVSPRLVLNASVSPDTDVTAFLSKSWFVLDTVTDDGVEDGSIQVFINDRLQGRMQPVSDSRFTGRYVLPGCRVRAGDRLRLEAEAGGFDLVGGETVIPDPVEVLSVDTVRYRPVADELTLTGRVAFNPEKVAQVYPIFGGTVVEVRAEIGDYVRRGDVLAVIRSGEVAEYEKQRKEAQHRLALAHRNLHSVQDMAASGMASEKDVMQARKEVGEAEAGETG